MKIETYKRKLQELQDKIKNTNPRYVNKIAEMKEEAKELRRKIKELEEKEKPASISKNRERNETKNQRNESDDNSLVRQLKNKFIEIDGVSWKNATHGDLTRQLKFMYRNAIEVALERNPNVRSDYAYGLIGIKNVAEGMVERGVGILWDKLHEEFLQDFDEETEIMKYML